MLVTKHHPTVHSLQICPLVYVLLDRPIGMITGDSGHSPLRSRNGWRTGRSPLRICEMSYDSLCHLVHAFQPPPKRGCLLH